MFNNVLTFVFTLLIAPALSAQSFSLGKAHPDYYPLFTQATNAIIYVDTNESKLVRISAELIQQDIEFLSGKKPEIVHTLPKSAKSIIIIGTVERSTWIQQLIQQNKIDPDAIKNKWEAYLIHSVSRPTPGIEHALIIAGSDRRGASYGVMTLSRELGVSPWYWWADVPAQEKKEFHIRKSFHTSDAPLVKYRGIFINDEAPALSGWAKEKFGGFNRLFYKKVFELMIRLKANYIWPAMWGNAFYDDDSLNRQTADDYGIVIGTSHHEPLMRAHDEWRRYGTGKWNYDSNASRLRDFWQGGMLRASNEKIVSVGMRGDGDEPMSSETATALLEKIVKDQRSIIEESTGRSAEATPQLWALYKEVQDYFDKGMRVPDDVTLLLCDDNWGNIRKLPARNEKPRKGGYGIYYHFDYVGGPRNYKWLNTNPIPKVWEQMHLAWEYKAREIWIVNVGDIKPMEFPISFFLDYAWNPERIKATDLQKYTRDWAAAQFGRSRADGIADILSTYAKYNGRRKPELLDANTYSRNYREVDRVTADYKMLLTRAEAINKTLPPELKDAYFQLILHPVKACANLHELYHALAWNRWLAERKLTQANYHADKAKQAYLRDSLITLEYHQLADGKWNHMMAQTHIGYTYWQQPPKQKMPEVKYVPMDSIAMDTMIPSPASRSAESLIPATRKGHIFFEKDGYVSIEANHFTSGVSSNGITWQILPDHGRTGSAITPFPVTAANQVPGNNSPHLQYEIYTFDTGKVRIDAYFSPSLNIHHNEGLQYAISIDEEDPTIISINKDDNNVRTWERWVANNIIIKSTSHYINRQGKHTIKYWMVTPAVVLQKLVVDLGGLLPSYLGPPETNKKQ
ncbi:MAG: glycosyl hydrolase 115 family protein [Chitinophagaceae bacterium]|nr:glycosyl hydrolase 115 family protein [Chitinophagaceae bacterium]